MAFFVEGPVYIVISKGFFLQFVDFNLSLLTHILCLELIYSGNSRCSAKEVAILLLSWITLYIVIK